MSFSFGTSRIEPSIFYFWLVHGLARFSLCTLVLPALFLCSCIYDTPSMGTRVRHVYRQQCPQAVRPKMLLLSGGGKLNGPYADCSETQCVDIARPIGMVCVNCEGTNSAKRRSWYQVTFPFSPSLFPRRERRHGCIYGLLNRSNNIGFRFVAFLLSFFLPRILFSILQVPCEDKGPHPCL